MKPWLLTFDSYKAQIDEISMIYFRPEKTGYVNFSRHVPELLG